MGKRDVVLTIRNLHRPILFDARCRGRLLLMISVVRASMILCDASENLVNSDSLDTELVPDTFRISTHLSINDACSMYSKEEVEVHITCHLSFLSGGSIVHSTMRMQMSRLRLKHPL
jgi:hypothetical protein